MTRPQRAPRKRAPSTNPTLAVARAEAARDMDTEEMPAVVTHPEDPPIFRETWNQLYGLPEAAPVT